MLVCEEEEANGLPLADYNIKMHKKILINILVVSSLLMAIGFNIYGRSKSEDFPPSHVELNLLIPEADFFKEATEPFLHYEAHKNNNLIGYCVNSKDVAPDVKGYSGPIEILIGFSIYGSIEGLKILHHAETSSYANGITERSFLDQFIGKGPKDRFIVGEDIDAITRATISSKTVANIVKICIERIQVVIDPARSPLASGPEARKDSNMDFYITILIITFLLVAFYFKKAFLRYTGLMISIVYFGFLKANFISMTNLGKLFLWNLPDPKTEIAWYVFIFAGVILTFLLGTFYCSYMCPFGGLQIFLNKLLNFKLEITPALASRLRKIKYILLWALTVLVISLNNPNIADYEPFSTVFLRKGSTVAWAIVIIILVSSLFHRRPFCNYFCAAGACLDMISKWGRKVFRRR